MEQRPFDERPAARPSATSQPATPDPPSQKRKGIGCFGWSLILVVAIVVIFVAQSVFSNSGSRTNTNLQSEVPVADAAAPSKECQVAVQGALSKESELYESHPLYSAEIPGVDASPDEFAAYEALQSDEEAQWQAAYAPVYEMCESPDDWWLAAKQNPGIAGVTDSSFVDSLSLELWCADVPEAQACLGLDEWLIANPDKRME